MKSVWMDSIIYEEDVFMSSYAFSGAEKIMMGSDFPHQIGDLELAVERIRRLKIGDEEKEKILGGNAVSLLKL